MIRTLNNAVQAFRLGAEAKANEHLVTFLDEIGKAATHPSVAQALVAAAPTLQQILDAQDRGDGIGVADLLEFELLPRLSELETAPRT